MKGHCPVCNGFIKVVKVINPGDAGYNPENEASNYRLVKHIRDDVGGECGRSDLPPDSVDNAL